MNRYRLAKNLVVAATLLVACQTPRSPANESDTPDDSPLAIRLSKNEKGGLVLEFRNLGDKPLYILKPLDGSYHSWVMPHYAYSIDDGNGTEFRLINRCGHFGSPYSDTAWPDDYLIEIGPKKTYTRGSGLPFIIPKDGEYTITFHYLFTPNSNLLPSGKHKYPKELWRGKATSNPLRLWLKAQK